MVTASRFETNITIVVLSVNNKSYIFIFITHLGYADSIEMIEKREVESTGSSNSGANTDVIKNKNCCAFVFSCIAT